MTKGRSTKLWITLLDPEIRNGEPRLVQVWRLYKDLPGSRRAPSSRPRYPPIRRRAPTTPPTPSTSPACGRATPPRRSRCAPRSAAPPAGSRASGRAWCSLSFATKDGGDWRTNICDGTGPDAEQTAIAALGEPLPISQAPATTSPRPSQDPRGNEKGVNEGSGGPTAPPEPGADVQEPGGQGRGSMAIPLLIIATAGLIARVTARLRE